MADCVVFLLGMCPVCGNFESKKRRTYPARSSYPPPEPRGPTAPREGGMYMYIYIYI